MSTYDNGNVSLLSQRVARDPEVVFGIGQDRCRLCRYFAPDGIYATDLIEGNGRCRLGGRNIVMQPGNTCDRFTRRT